MYTKKKKTINLLILLVGFIVNVKMKEDNKYATRNANSRLSDNK